MVSLLKPDYLYSIVNAEEALNSVSSEICSRLQEKQRSVDKTGLFSYAIYEVYVYLEQFFLRFQRGIMPQKVILIKIFEKKIDFFVTFCYTESITNLSKGDAL